MAQTIRMPEPHLLSEGQEEEMRAQAQLGFARKLSSPNIVKREKAMSLLCLWLSSQKVLKEDELRKIWKGLFFCVWYADKSQTEADMVDRLASLMEKLSVDLSVQFFKAFLSTMRREWAHIDKLRIERFYLLLRKYIHHMFVVLEINGWEANLTRKFLNVFVEAAFLSKDQYAADSMNFHIVDVFLRTLKRFSPITVEAFELLLEPFWVVLSKGYDKDLAKRARERVFHVLFDLGFRALTAEGGAHDNLDENVKRFGILALSMPISSKALELAALPTIAQSNRRLLHEIHEEFASLERLMVESGMSIVANNLGREFEIRGGGLRASQLSMVNDDLNLDAKCGSVSPKQKSSVRSLRLDVKNRQKTALSPWFPKTADNSIVNIEVHGNIPPGQVLGVSEVKESLKECLKQGRAEGLMETDTESSTGKKQKRGQGRVLGASMPNVRLERQSQAVGNAEACQERQNVESANQSQQAKPSVRQSTRDQGIWAFESEKITTAGTDPPCDQENYGDNITTDDSVISNLSERFDSIAAEESIGIGAYISSELLSPFGLSPINTGSKKRKSLRTSPGTSVDTDNSGNIKGNGLLSPLGDGAVSAENTSTKKAKKVRFCLKHNLVWKPSTPLPPHVLRVPPAATPRGSALKKGVPPGPILFLTEMSPKAASKSPSRSPKSLKASSRGSKITKKASRSPGSLKASSRGSKITKKPRLSPR